MRNYLHVYKWDINYFLVESSICFHLIICTFSKQSLKNLYIFAAFIASRITRIGLTAAKLTCPCNTLQTSNSFARSDTGVVIYSEPHPSRTFKTSFLFAPLAVSVQAGCSAFTFYKLHSDKTVNMFIFKCKTVLIPKLKIIFMF